MSISEEEAAKQRALFFSVLRIALEYLGKRIEEYENNKETRMNDPLRKDVAELRNLLEKAKSEVNTAEGNPEFEVKYSKSNLKNLQIICVALKVYSSDLLESKDKVDMMFKGVMKYDNLDTELKNVKEIQGKICDERESGKSA